MVVSSLAGIVALKAFLPLNPREAAVLIGLLGYLAFMPLAQFGFGRPCYGEVRERFVGKTLRVELVRSFLRLFGWQSAVAAFLFAALAVLFAMSQGYGSSRVGLFAFALGQAALGACTYQRDIAYALSCDPTYENWELIRRCSALVTYLMVLIGWPLWLGGVLGLASAGISQVRIARHLTSMPAYGAGASAELRWRDLQPKLGTDARRYFAFSLNELLFYNMPLLVFTAISAQQGIIYFGVWTKLFLLTVLPMRMVVDARVNRQTAAYFSKDLAAVRSALIQSLQLAFLVVLTCAAVAFLFKSTILRWVGAAAMDRDALLIPAITIWCAGNAIQHVFGSFTISYRDGFTFAFRASLLSLAVVGGVFTASVLMGRSPGGALLASGMAYFLCAWIYVQHVWRLLKSPLPIGGRP